MIRQRRAPSRLRRKVLSRSSLILLVLFIIANFLSLPSYPVWSVVMIAISAFIIWALCTTKKSDF